MHNTLAFGFKAMLALLFTLDYPWFSDGEHVEDGIKSSQGTIWFVPT